MLQRSSDHDTSRLGLGHARNERRSLMSVHVEKDIEMAVHCRFRLKLLQRIEQLFATRNDKCRGRDFLSPTVYTSG